MAEKDSGAFVLLSSMQLVLWVTGQEEAPQLCSPVLILFSWKSEKNIIGSTSGEPQPILCPVGPALGQRRLLRVLSREIWKISEDGWSCSGRPVLVLQPLRVKDSLCCAAGNPLVPQSWCQGRDLLLLPECPH